MKPSEWTRNLFRKFVREEPLAVLEHRRFGTASESTIATLTFEKKSFGYVLEDQYQPDGKVPGETCIPTGLYPLQLRTEGGMHKQYQKRFGWQHHGMLWIRHIPDFRYVYYHIGNDDDETLGCPLTGMMQVELPDGNWEVRQSEVAYKRLYAALAPRLLMGEKLWVRVSDKGMKSRV